MTLRFFRALLRQKNPQMGELLKARGDALSLIKEFAIEKQIQGYAAKGSPAEHAFECIERMADAALQPVSSGGTGNE